MVFQKESEARQDEGLSYGPAAGPVAQPESRPAPRGCVLQAVSCRRTQVNWDKSEKKKAESERTKADRLTGRKKNFQRHCGFITPDGKDQKLSRAMQP